MAFAAERNGVITYDFGISETTDQRGILFADVCESTRIYETIGDAKALALINGLFKALTKQVNTHGGITVKTLGDGMVCQFRDPEEAFKAACGMQEAAAALAAGKDQALKIKIGYTYGPVVLKDRDVFGDTVNVCARLVSLANPSQILTTAQTVEALPAGSRSRCRDLYATKVRNRSAEVMVCEVLWKTDPDATRINTVALKTAPKTSLTWVLKLTYAGDTVIVDSTKAMRLGRDASNDLVINTDNASRMHARIFAKDEQFYIADQSTNGTYLLVDGTTREVRLRRSEAMLGERGWIGVGKSAAKHGDHVLRYRLERQS